MINDNDVPLFDLPTLDSYAGAYETQQALNHAALFGARYRIQFISSSVFSWLDAPDNAEDAQLDGEMVLGEALNQLQSQGLTFVQSGSMQTSSLEGSGVANWALDWIGAADAETDYVHEVTVQLNAISPNLSAEALENLIDNAKLSLTLNGMLNNVQEEQYLEASSVKEIAILLLSASALLASSGFVFVSVHPAAADRVKSIVDSAVAPISAALLLYFATKLK